MKKEIDEYFLRLDEYCKDLIDKAIKSSADDLEKVNYLVEELAKFEDRKEQFETVKEQNPYNLAIKLERAQDGNILSKEIVEHIKFLEKEKSAHEIGSEEYFKSNNQINELWQTTEVIKSKMESGIEYFDASWFDKDGNRCDRHDSEDLVLKAIPLTEFEQNIHKSELQRVEHMDEYMDYVGHLDPEGDEVHRNIDFSEEVNNFWEIVDKYQEPNKKTIDLDDNGYGW